MDSGLSEECVKADTQMTILQDEEVLSEEGPGMSDDVEDLRKSLREAVRDDAVTPKLHCLMMDSSFSMVTVQGEDSGIQWETTSSRCSTPGAFDGRPGDSGGVAGRVTIIMDEDKIVRRKSANGRGGGGGRRSRADRKTPMTDGDAEVPGAGAAERPELVEVSQPNVRAEGHGGGGGGGGTEPAAEEEKEQRLFRLVSDGSEILNILVPPRLATVDEEESRAMEDHLSYLDQTPVTKGAGKEKVEEALDPRLGVAVSGQAEEMERGGAPAAPPAKPDQTDPPGAPVSGPPRREAAPVGGDADYFEVDSQDAPGGPAAVTAAPEEEKKEEELEAEEEARGGRASGEPQPPEDGGGDRRRSSAAATAGTGGDDIIIGEHLDQAFYGGAKSAVAVGSFPRDEAAAAGAGERRAPPKALPKASGAALFDTQEDIVLTPIFLSPGPPKIIDPALLDEPVAMAFLYTDLYEEAQGSREKDEDAESVTSERSFHSRHSDREDRGYLEKFVLKDETPVVMDDAELDEDDRGEEVRLWSGDSYDLGGRNARDEAAKTGDGLDGADSEEVTDFFRTCASSSPSDAEPLLPPPSPEGEADAAEPEKKKEKEKEGGVPSQKAQSVPRDATPAPSSPPGEAGGGESVPRRPVAMAIPPAGRPVPVAPPRAPPPPPSPGSGAVAVVIRRAPKPVAPPRRKTVLELTPLTPVDTAEERETGTEEEGGKEQREEEKETASPPETADEGDGEEAEKDDNAPSSSLVRSQDAPSSAAEGGGVSEAEPAGKVEEEEEDIYSEGRETTASHAGRERERPDAGRHALRDEGHEGDAGAETTDSAAAVGVAKTEEAEPEAGEAELAEKRSAPEPGRNAGRCIIQ